MEDPSVTVDIDAVGSYTIKLQSAEWELNLTVPTDEVLALRRVPVSPWRNGSIRVGTSANAAAFWSLDEDGQVSVLVGHDDQTWDFGVTIPMAMFEEILREIETTGAS